MARARVSLGFLFKRNRSAGGKSVDANLERKLHGDECALEALCLKFESGAGSFVVVAEVGMEMKMVFKSPLEL